MIAYRVSKNMYFNTWKHTEINRELFKQSKLSVIEEEVAVDEGHSSIIYPVRKEFLNIEKKKKYKFSSEDEFKYLYTGFENNKVEFSNFIRNATRLETDHMISLISHIDTEIEVEIKTCGKMITCVNDKCIDVFSPFISNYGASKTLKIKLKKGENKIVVKTIDLAERNVFYYFSMKLLTDIELNVSINLDINQDEYSKVLKYFESFNFETDVFTTDVITFDANYTLCKNLPKIYLEFSDGFNIYNKLENQLELYELDCKIGKLDLSNLNDFSSYVNLVTYINGFQIKKRFFISKKSTKVPKIKRVDDRKKYIIDHISSYGQNNIYKTIAKVVHRNEYIDMDDKGITDVLYRVNTRGDCADFYLPGAMVLLSDYVENITQDVYLQLKHSILNFRYWIDEPGDDVMWYFSENHALLFHVCQYLGGHLFPNDVFLNSKRTGIEQKKNASSRLDAWLDNFLKVGLSEWNSTTYIPVDLIGLFVLHEYVDDLSIKKKTIEALNYIFKIMAINLSGSMISGTYGRCYEKELKAMEFGELSCVGWMAWNRGYTSTMTKSTILYALSSYEPPREYMDYFENAGKTVINYYQGENMANIKVYKEEKFSLSSVQNYKVQQKGHQQHVMNISLGNDNTQLWINHPGELVPSGENRPSYWSGNGIMPQVEQNNNFIYMSYNLQHEEVQFIHAYIPFWKLDDVFIKGNLARIKKGDVIATYIFSSEIELTNSGPNKNREIKVYGEKISLIVHVSTCEEIDMNYDFQNNIFEIGGTKYKVGL